MKRDVALAAAVAAALAFAVLWGRSEYRRGRADERTWAYGVALRHLTGDYAMARTILTDRAAVEGFMEASVGAYQGLVSSFAKVAPPMPESTRMPADAVLREKAFLYFKTYGVPYPDLKTLKAFEPVEGEIVPPGTAAAGDGPGGTP